MNKNTSLKATSGFIVGMLISVSSINAFAQVGTIIGGGGVQTGGVLQGPGTYTVEQYDRTALERIATDHFSANQAEDKQFLFDTSAAIKAELDKIAVLNASPDGFFALYRESTRGPVDSVRYALAQQNLQTQINLAENSLQTLFLIPSAIKSPSDVTVRGEVVTTLPPKLRVDLEQIKAFYEKQINAMIGQVNVLPLNIRLSDDSIVPIVGFSYMVPTNRLNFKVLEQERLAALRDATIDLSQLEIINDLNRHNLNLIRSTIKTFGTSQRYRFNLNKDGRDRNLETLAEAFWARSYLRSVFGVKLGAITVDYTKNVANWDFFASSNKLVFLGEFVSSDSDLNDYQDKLANALVSQAARNKEVFGEGVDILSRIMSGLTFLKGESQLASINVVVLELLKYDIEMEQQLGKPGGLKAVRTSYRSNYYRTPEMEAFIKERAKAYASMINLDAEAGVEDDMMVIGQGSDLKGEFMKSVQALQTVVDKVDQAKRRLVAIEALRGDNKTRDNVKKRTDL